MRRSDASRGKRSTWDDVYRLVRRIPRGRVMTYGQVAELLGKRISPRYVGFAMHVCPKSVPWHRVVNASGGCSTDRLPGGCPGLQRILLEREGVRFLPSGRLALQTYRWAPLNRTERKESRQPTALSRGLGLLLVVVSLSAAVSCRRGWHGLVLSHGEEIRVENYAVSGKYTVIDFYSDDCPACLRLSPDLEALDDKRSDIVVVKVDVDRPGTRGIDWSSPVARQYGLQQLPHLIVFGKDQRMSAQGDDALEMVAGWMSTRQ